MAVNGANRATGAFAVTPNDSTDLAKPAEALWVGVGGTLKITMRDGSVVTLITVPAGLRTLGVVKRVWATGTTCTDIVAFY